MKNFWYLIGVVIGLAVLGFGYYALSPLFITLKADDVAPEATYDLGPGEPPSPAETVVGVRVVGTTAHPASGRVRLVSADGTTYVRYENFKTINGPDIYVYLAKDLGAKEFVSLGQVKATEGNVNYLVPAGVNVADYRYVLIWCKQFGVLFNYADLTGGGV